MEEFGVGNKASEFGIFIHESRAGYGAGEELLAAFLRRWHTANQWFLKLNVWLFSRERIEFKCRIISILLFLKKILTLTLSMPSITNLEEENPKSDIWSSDSIVMYGTTTLWSLSLRELKQDFGDHLVQGVLNLGLIYRLQGVCKFPEIICKVLCVHVFGERGHQILNGVCGPQKLKITRQF